MAQLNYGVDQNDLEQDGFGLLPAGDYKVIIESSDYIPNNANTGKILKLIYQIIDGPKKGQKIFENLNLENPNQQAVEISKRALNAIGVAVGVTTVQDSAQLHNIPLILTLGVRGKETDQYGIQNVVKKHLPINGNVVSNTSAPVQSNETVTPKNPWEK